MPGNFSNTLTLTHTFPIEGTLSARLLRARTLCGVIGLALTAGCSHTTPGGAALETSSGRVAAAAVSSMFRGPTANEPLYQLDVFRRGEPPGRSSPAAAADVDAVDPYLAWLAAELMRQASNGELFVRVPSGTQLRFSDLIGDTRYWYIAELHTPAADGRAATKVGPWLIWCHTANMVQLRGPDDRSWRSEYNLPGIVDGDLIVLDLYRVQRAGGDSSSDVNPQLAVRHPEARVSLRLHLPVVLR